MPLDLDEIGETTRTDFRRANGTPMVVIDGKNERFSRPSSFAKPLDDESALVNWRIDRGCIGVAKDRALQARWIAMADDDRDGRGKLRDDSISAGRGAERADIGTALHAMSCRWEQEPNFNPPEPYFSSLTAYEREMKLLGLESIRFEYHTVNIQYRCAGTADRLYEATKPLMTPDGDVLPVGTLLVGDLKTGDKLEYSKAAYAVQLALYAEGEMYDVLTDEFIPTPPINRDWAIIVHMPADEAGRCEFLWVDLAVGRHGAYLVEQIKLWRKMWRSGEFKLDPVLIDVALPPAEIEPCWCGNPDDDAVVHQTVAPCYVVPAPVVEAASAKNMPDNGGAPEPLDGHIEWARERITQIASHPPAKAALLRDWPTGVPTPKQGIENIEQVVTINALLSKIEADFELSFVPRPVAIQSTGLSTRKRKGK